MLLFPLAVFMNLEDGDQAAKEKHRQKVQFV
jgi:hypothetical protein